MPDLAAPQYAGYLGLCRELRLHRTLRFGDVVDHGPSSGIAIVAPHSTLVGRHTGEDLVWIPQLGDWFDLLEEIGPLFEGVYVSRLNIGRGQWRADIGREYRAEASTREEAIARLWILVSDAQTRT